MQLIPISIPTKRVLIFFIFSRLFLEMIPNTFFNFKNNLKTIFSLSFLFYENNNSKTI